MCVYIYIMIYIYVLYGFIMIYIDCIVDVVGQMHTSHSQGPVPQAHQVSHSPTFTTHNGDTTWNQSRWIDRSLNHRLEPWSKASCRSLAVLKFMPTLWRARHYEAAIAKSLDMQIFVDRHIHMQIFVPDKYQTDRIYAYHYVDIYLICLHKMTRISTANLVIWCISLEQWGAKLSRQLRTVITHHEVVLHLCCTGLHTQ